MSKTKTGKKLKKFHSIAFETVQKWELNRWEEKIQTKRWLSTSYDIANVMPFVPWYKNWNSFLTDTSNDKPGLRQAGAKNMWPSKRIKAPYNFLNCTNVLMQTLHIENVNKLQKVWIIVYLWWKHMTQLLASRLPGTTHPHHRSPFRVDTQISHAVLDRNLERHIFHKVF